MRTISAILLLVVATSANAQTVDVYRNAQGWQAVPTQCGGGGCGGGFCPGGGCGGGWCPQGGGCPGGMCPPQMQQPPQDEGPRYDQPQTNLPRYETRPQQPLQPPVQQPQPLPAPPPLSNPPINTAPPDVAPLPPPAPTVDPQALKDQQTLLERTERIEKSLLIIKETKGCNCQPTDLTEIIKRLDAIEAKLGQTPKASTLNFVNSTGKVVASAAIQPGATTGVTLPPINFRIQDSRGASFSTDYQPAQLGSYVTLPFGPAQQ